MSAMEANGSVHGPYPLHLLFVSFLLRTTVIDNALTAGKQD